MRAGTHDLRSFVSEWVRALIVPDAAELEACVCDFVPRRRRANLSSMPHGESNQKFTGVDKIGCGASKRAG